MTVVVYLAMCVLPVSLLQLITHGLPDMDRLRDRLHHTRTRRDERHERDKLVADLRRLGADHDSLMRANRPARANQMRAIERAYDDTLRQACLALHVEAPATDFDDLARVQVEADLLVRGLTW